MRVQRLKGEHRRLFGDSESEQCVVIAPFRICPLGAHVDHQLGLVSGIAIENSIIMVFTPNPGGNINLFSANFPDSKSFPINAEHKRVFNWSDYARGAVMALSRKFALKTGIDAVLEGDIPIGGLSSSAAVGVAYLLALQSVNGIQSTNDENVELDRIIENDFIGLNNGILDQSVILLSERNRLLYLDCMQGTFETIEPGAEMPPYEVTVVFSGVTKKLMDTDYNNRVKECEAAAGRLMELSGAAWPAGETLKLGHVDYDVFENFKDSLEPVSRKRAEHFYSECRRVADGVEAWREGNIEKIGALMRESGESSIMNYECGCPPMITLAEIMNETPGIHGARFSGAGFRGCCIAFSDPARRAEISERISADYPARHPEFADSFSVNFCTPGDGAGVL